MSRFFSILAILAICFVSCNKAPKLDQLESQYITLDDGSKVHYKVCGKGGITLCFVHGFGCDVNVWQKQYEDFFKDTIRMVFIDLPGYGKSDKPEVEYTLPYFADAVNRVLDSLGVSRVVMVGHSLGSAVCRQLIFDHPVKVSAFCDIDGVYCFYGTETSLPNDYEESINQFVEQFHGANFLTNMEQFIVNMEGPFTPDYISNYALETMMQTPEQVAYSTMSNLVKKDYWTGEKINIPSLILCTHISGIDPDNKQKMDELYNDATYVELQNTGHFIMMEDAGIVNNLLERSYEKWKQTEL